MRWHFSLIWLAAASVACCGLRSIHAAPPNSTDTARTAFTIDDTAGSDNISLYDQSPGQHFVIQNYAPSAAPGAGTSNEGDAAKKAAEAKKKAAADLKTKVGTAFKDPFYLNDFSYLANPNYKDFHMGENLKGLPVGDCGKLDFGGQYRLRYHNEHNMRGLGLTGRDDSFLLDRTRFYLNYKANDRIRIFSEFLDAGSSGENFAPRQIEVQHLDIQNLFVDFVLYNEGGTKVTSRTGRQEILFGNQRLLSPLDWANNRRRFDGERVTIDNADRTVDALWLRPQKIDFNQVDSANLDQQLYGFYAQSKRFEFSKPEFYYLGFEDKSVDLSVQTIGTRIWGEAEGYLWDNELGYQFGRNTDGSDISAASITLGGGRKLKGEWKPTLWFYYDWASGDDSAGNGWNQLFPLGHKYLGFMDFFGRRNIQDLNATLTLAPTDRLTWFMWYHYFSLNDLTGGPQNVTGTPFNPGGTQGSRDLGHEIDLLSTYKITPRSDLVLGYSHFFAGRYYSTSRTAANAPLFNGDADFFYTQWHINF